jgi:hypothetical protein
VKNTVYNDHVAALSRAGGIIGAILNSGYNPLRLVAVELGTRFAPRFA